MIKVKKHGIILKPTRNDFEAKSVFNPGVLQEGNTVHLVYRAMSKDFVSSFGYARLSGPTKIVERMKKPIYTPILQSESKGIEDPCLVKINNTIYMTYVAHDGKNAVIGYMFGKNILKLKRGGIISPRISYSKLSELFGYSRLKDDYYLFAAFYEKYNDDNILVWEKDGVLFPEKFNGRFLLLHRILPDIQMIYFNKFSQLKTKTYWEKYLRQLDKYVVMEGKYGFEARHIGAGAPPIKTKDGWLMIYHGVEPQNKGRIYRANAALLDLKNPRKLIARLPYPLFSPEKNYETRGHVNNVVFPTGTALFGERLYIYYGTSDSYTAVASVNINDLRKELLKYKNR